MIVKSRWRGRDQDKNWWGSVTRGLFSRWEEIWQKVRKWSQSWTNIAWETLAYRIWWWLWGYSDRLSNVAFPLMMLTITLFVLSILLLMIVSCIKSSVKWCDCNSKFQMMMHEKIGRRRTDEWCKEKVCRGEGWMRWGWHGISPRSTKRKNTGIHHPHQCYYSRGTATSHVLFSGCKIQSWPDLVWKQIKEGHIKTPDDADDDEEDAVLSPRLQMLLFGCCNNLLRASDNTECIHWQKDRRCSSLEMQ